MTARTPDNRRRKRASAGEHPAAGDRQPPPRTTVFTDGAAKGNPGPGGWGAVIATHDGRVIEFGGGSPHTTNNQMELTAVIRALRHLRGTPGALDVYSDSTYVIRGISEWIHNWRRRGWRTVDGQPVLNQTLWEELAHLVGARGRGTITWHHVRGHTAVPGNERADRIAVAFAAARHVDLYRGPRADYPVRLDLVPADTALPARGAGPRPGKNQPAYSYLSLVDGTPMRHASWAECERRVKGVSGARFKKARSADDEAAILAAWGVSLEDLTG